MENSFVSAKCVVRGAWFLTTHYERRTTHLILILGMMAMAQMFAWSAHAVEESASKIDGFNLEGFGDNGEKAWEVNGEKADMEGLLIKLTNIIAHSYGAEHYQVTAKKGSVNQTDQKIHLQEDVVIRKDDGSRLTTDTLDWDRKADTIKTDDRVTIVDTKNNMMVTGTGMETHPDRKQATIQEDVRLRVEPQDKTAPQDTVIITSDGPMSMDQLAQIATFEKNVRIIQNGKTVTADRAEAHFAADTKKIKEVVCIGNVEIFDGTNRSYADRSVYNVTTQKMELFGRPKLILDTKGQDVFAPAGN